MIIHEKKTYDFLKSRIKNVSDEIKPVLEILTTCKDGFYHQELLRKMDCSDSLLRPITSSLYSAGFIDIKEKGNMKFYLINENGTKLLNDMNGEI